MEPMRSLFKTFKERKRQKKVNKEIERQIEKDKLTYRRTHRVLLLGAGGSGKTTLMEQMRILHLERPFANEVKKQKILEIRRNIRYSMTKILNAMTSIDPPLKCAEPDNTAKRKWYLEQVNKSGPDNFDYSECFFDITEELWKDMGVQECFARSNEYELMDNAKYFLEKVDAVRQENFSPSAEDMLRANVITTGMSEMTFQVPSTWGTEKFHVIDIGWSCSQQQRRRKLIQCFEDLTAIIFLASSSSYDIALSEDKTENQLKKDLELFRSIVNNPWLRNVPILLFLNKQDLLEDKIRAGRHKLEDYFPDFVHYVIPPEAEWELELRSETADKEFVRAKYFIRDAFLRISQQAHEEDKYALRRLHCYPYFTCAVDTENIRSVFNDCRDVIHRLQYGRWCAFNMNSLF